MSTLRFGRPMFYPDRLRNYQLIIDGVQMGEIGAGSAVEIPATAGRHEVVARIDWCSSNTLHVELKKGVTCDLEVGSNLGGWRIILVMVYIAFLPSEYLYLRLLTPQKLK